MQQIKFEGKEGVFFTKKEYLHLCNKITENNDLIKQLIDKEGLK